MAFEYANTFTALSAVSATSVDVRADNGLLVDGAGNRLYLGTKQSGFDYRGFQSQYVDRVASEDGTPTGDVTVANGAIQVNGTTVTLTDATGQRRVDTVGGTDGNDGDLTVDGNGSLQIEYTTTSTNRIRTANSTSDPSTSVLVEDTIPNGADPKFMSGAVKAPETDATGSVEGTFSFDTDGDGIAEVGRTISDSAGDSSNTNTRVTSGISTGVQVSVSGSSFHETNTTLEQATVAIVYEETTTTTKTPSVTLF